MAQRNMIYRKKLYAFSFPYTCYGTSPFTLSISTLWIYTVQLCSSLACTIKLSFSHQSEDVSQLLSCVINGTQHQAERHTERTMSILNGHYCYKSSIVLLDNRQGLDTVKVNLCTFCSNNSACFWSEALQMGWGWGGGRFTYTKVTYNLRGTWVSFQIYKVTEKVTHPCTHSCLIKVISIYFIPSVFTQLAVKLKT